MTTTELGMEDSEDKCSPDNGDGFKRNRSWFYGILIRMIWARK